MRIYFPPSPSLLHNLKLHPPPQTATLTSNHHLPGTASSTHPQPSAQLKVHKTNFSAVYTSGTPKKMPETTIRRPVASSIHVVVGM